jgi:hypothetical protein
MALLSHLHALPYTLNVSLIFGDGCLVRQKLGQKNGCEKDNMTMYYVLVWLMTRQLYYRTYAFCHPRIVLVIIHSVWQHLFICGRLSVVFVFLCGCLSVCLFVSQLAYLFTTFVLSSTVPTLKSHWPHFGGCIWFILCSWTQQWVLQLLCRVCSTDIPAKVAAKYVILTVPNSLIHVHKCKHSCNVDVHYLLSCIFFFMSFLLIMT